MQTEFSIIYSAVKRQSLTDESSGHLQSKTKTRSRETGKPATQGEAMLYERGETDRQGADRKVFRGSVVLQTFPKETGWIWREGEVCSGGFLALRPRVRAEYRL